VRRLRKPVRPKRRATISIFRRSCAGRRTDYELAGPPEPHPAGCRRCRNGDAASIPLRRGLRVARPDRSPRGVAVGGAFASVATDGFDVRRCVVVRKVETQRESGFGRASSPTDGASPGNRQQFCPVLNPASPLVSLARNRYVADLGGAKKLRDSARKNTIRAPLNHANTHQICVKRLTARVPPSVVFLPQNCRFRTSLNFYLRNRCASIPRVLSAPAPGVTP
jgi:hypothetical protein